MTLSEAWVDFIAGWASGAASVLTMQPVDTVLTRFQAASSTAIVQQQTRGLVSSDGFQALWRGSSAMISAVPMQNAMLMGGYGVGKQWAAQNDSEDALMSVFIGGCTGGILQSFLMSPVELMKVNQQVIGKSARDAAKELIRGLSKRNQSWRGLSATLLRDGIPHGVWFASYEWCKTFMVKQNENSLAKGKSTSSYEQLTVPLTSGAVAATVAWGVGYPFDLIKTRIQATHGISSTQGIYQTAIDLIKEANGRTIAGLYRGFGLKLVRAVPASMIGFTTYEYVAGQIRR